MSSVIIRHMKASDIYDIRKRPQTEGVDKTVPVGQAMALEAQPYSRTVCLEDGEILGVGGVIERWPGRAECWAVLAPGTRKYMPEITKLTKEVLDSVEINRIEIAVRCDFAAGHEWATELGFKAEAECLEAYDAEGYDCSIYSRVKRRKGDS